MIVRGLKMKHEGKFGLVHAWVVGGVFGPLPPGGGGRHSKRAWHPPPLVAYARVWHEVLGGSASTLTAPTLDAGRNLMGLRGVTPRNGWLIGGG